MEREQLETITQAFCSRFGGDPRLFRAPGRVNLIGEHTDYNEGFVMPFAIDRQAVIAGKGRDDRRLRAVAFDLNESIEIGLDDEPKKLRGNWIDLIEGTAREVDKRFGPVKGADVLLSSNVPIGAGLSSSAAIEIAFGLAFLVLSGIEPHRQELAFAAQRAEHDHAGVRSGIMDQFASLFCRAGHAMLLDCRSLEREHISIDHPDVVMAVCNSGVKHSLASTEYNKRREECESGIRLLREHLPEAGSLRDVTIDQLEEYAGILPHAILKRCRHVVTENERTLKAANAFRNADLHAAGDAMSASHRSLRDDYEVSCAELDLLVELGQTQDGVYGSRMTGGGFGGCTISLVERASLADFERSIDSGFRERFGRSPEIYSFHASAGASEIAT